MKKEEWTAVVDAFVIIASLLAAYFFDAQLADLFVAVVGAAQPVVLLVLVKMYGERKAAEIESSVRAVMRELRRD